MYSMLQSMYSAVLIVRAPRACYSSVSNCVFFSFVVNYSLFIAIHLWPHHCKWKFTSQLNDENIHCISAFWLCVLAKCAIFTIAAKRETSKTIDEEREKENRTQIFTLIKCSMLMHNVPKNTSDNFKFHLSILPFSMHARICMHPKRSHKTYNDFWTCFIYYAFQFHNRLECKMRMTEATIFC